MLSGPPFDFRVSKRPCSASRPRNGRAFAADLLPEKPVSPPDAKPDVGIVWAYGGKLTIARPPVVDQIVGGILGENYLRVAHAVWDRP